MLRKGDVGLCSRLITAQISHIFAQYLAPTQTEDIRAQLSSKELFAKGEEMQNCVKICSVLGRLP